MLTTVKQIQSLLTKRHTIEHILHCLVDTVHHQLETKYSAIILADPATEYLKIQTAHGLSQSFMNRFQRLAGTGAVGKMMMGGESIMLNSIDKQSSSYADLQLESEYTSIIASRISAFAKHYGYIICQRTNDIAFLNEDLLLLDIIAQAVAIALHQHQLTAENKELTVIDKETGIYKFPFFCDKLVQEIERAQRYNEQISVLLIDIDNYKEFYRSYGAQAALELLNKLISITQKQCVGLDVIGRYGQDKIVVSLINKDEEQAAQVAQRIKDEMYQFDFYRPNNPVSIAVYCCLPDDIRDINRIADRLGTTLFHAHYNNGNQVSRWSTCMYGFPG